jgi:hypothetical protein
MNFFKSVLLIPPIGLISAMEEVLVNALIMAKRRRVPEEQSYLVRYPRRLRSF